MQKTKVIKMDQMLKIDCPYGASDCPKVAELKDDMRAIKRTLYLVVIFLAAEFGTTFLAVIA